MDFNQICCGDHFALYANIKPHCIPETNIVLEFNYTLIEKNFKIDYKEKIFAWHISDNIGIYRIYEELSTISVKKIKTT